MLCLAGSYRLFSKDYIFNWKISRRARFTANANAHMEFTEIYAGADMEI